MRINIFVIDYTYCSRKILLSIAEMRNVSCIHTHKVWGTGASHDVS